MPTVHKVAVVIGSLRKGSLTRNVANALCGFATERLKMEIVEIGDLPLYNADRDENPPAPWVELRRKIAASDAVLFATPEYNRSVPGVLKNAIDIASRPYGKSAWAGKPAAIVSVSPGAIGAFGANHHLRQMLVFLDMPAMQQPEAYIGNAAKLFGDDGQLTNKDTAEFLRKIISSFEAWIDRIRQ
jgi:chromate reductase